MNLWWKLTVEWPCVLSDWLWAFLVAPLLARLEQLTFKRVVYLAALTLAVIALAQVVSLDVAILSAGDTVFYFEVACAVTFFVVRGYVRQTLYLAIHKMRAAARGLVFFMRRYGGIVRQRRNANALRRRSKRPKRSDDEPAAWGQYVLALAGAGVGP
jgi:hypothetical protein